MVQKFKTVTLVILYYPLFIYCFKKKRKKEIDNLMCIVLQRATEVWLPEIVSIVVSGG